MIEREEETQWASSSLSSDLFRMASDIFCLCVADFGMPFKASEILFRCCSDMGPMRLSLFHALFPFNDCDNFFRCSSDMGPRLQLGIGVTMTGSSFCRPKLIIVAKLKGCFSFCLSSAQCQHFDSRKRGTGDSVHVTIHSRNVDTNSLDLFIPFCPNPRILKVSIQCLFASSFFFGKTISVCRKRRSVPWALSPVNSFFLPPG